MHACGALAGHKCSLKESKPFYLLSSADLEQVLWPPPYSNQTYLNFKNMHISSLLEVYFPRLQPVVTGNSQSPRAPESLCETQGKPDNLSALSSDSAESFFHKVPTPLRLSPRCCKHQHHYQDGAGDQILDRSLKNLRVWSIYWACVVENSKEPEYGLESKFKSETTDLIRLCEH